MQPEVTRMAQLTGNNGQFRKASGRWLGVEAEQSEWHSAERGSERIPCRKKGEEGTGGWKWGTIKSRDGGLRKLDQRRRRCRSGQEGAAPAAP